MSLTIQLSDEQVTVLQAKAAAEGLSLEAWIQKLAKQDKETPAERPLQTAADIILSPMCNVPGSRAWVDSETRNPVQTAWVAWRKLRS
jgi:hypothetical protein